MDSLPPTGSSIGRPASSIQLENQATNSQAQPEIPDDSMADGSPKDIESKALLAKKPRKKTAKSRNARAGSAGPPVEAVVDGEPAYRLSRVQKIVKTNDQVQISREAVFVMALAAEHITRRLTRAGCDVAKDGHRLDLSLSDLATAVHSSASLSFLSEVIPQTVPLSTARARRLTKDITPFPPDATQVMIARIQDQLRHSTRPITAYATHVSNSNKTGPSGGPGTTTAVMMPPPGGVSIPIRNYSPREAAAVAKAKASQGSGSNGRSFIANATGMPIGPMVPLPPGFDYRTLPGMPPPPPPGMAYHHLDPESYRNGIRWAPVQAQQSSGSGDAQAPVSEAILALPTGVWTDASGQLVMPPPPSPHLYQALPPPPTQQHTSSSVRRTPSSSTKAPRKRKQSGNLSNSQTQSQPSPSPVPAETSDIASESVPAAPDVPSTQPTPAGSGTTPGSPFHPGQLQGRTIYSAGAGGAFAPAPSPKVPKANGSPKKKRTSAKGRGSAPKKPWERGEEGEDGDSMDLNS